MFTYKGGKRHETYGGGHLPNNTPEKGVGPRSEEEVIAWSSVVKRKQNLKLRPDPSGMLAWEPHLGLTGIARDESKW